jgi:hypothetical protein
MYKIDETELFVKIDDKVISIGLEKIIKLLKIQKNKLNETKLHLSEMISLVIIYQYSGFKNFKQFWYEKKHNYKDKLFPNIPSYSVLNSWKNRLYNVLKTILETLIKPMLNDLSFVDSTKLETHEKTRKGKVHRNSKKGYTSFGEFHGFKLHILLNNKMQINSFDITSGNVHDINFVKDVVLKEPHLGKILADSAYVGKDIYYEAMSKNLHLIAKPKQNMMENNALGMSYLPNWDKNFKQIYKKRIKIESFFNILKNNFSIKINQTHCTNALFSIVYSALIAIQLLKNNDVNIIVI